MWWRWLDWRIDTESHSSNKLYSSDDDDDGLKDRHTIFGYKCGRRWWMFYYNAFPNCVSLAQWKLYSLCLVAHHTINTPHTRATLLWRRPDYAKWRCCSGWRLFSSSIGDWGLTVSCWQMRLCEWLLTGGQFSMLEDDVIQFNPSSETSSWPAASHFEATVTPTQVRGYAQKLWRMWKYYR